jgi:hypothetical protein
LLLRAALQPGEHALPAWRAWRGRVALDALDWSSQRLLPLLYHNLSKLGVNDPLMPRLKGVYRHTWARNQVILRGLTSVLRDLRTAGVPTLVAKGAGLVQYYEGNPGLRGMGDCDVLVPTSRAAAAIDVLVAAGWTATVGVSPRTVKQWIVPRMHAWAFRSPAGAVLDLHWHLLRASLEPDADLPFWEASVPLQIGMEETRVLNPTDMLLHVCSHGAQGEAARIATSVWVADAVMILRQAAPALDGARLLAEAHRRRLLLPFREALRYVCETFDVPAARHLVEAFHERRVSLLERLEHRAAKKPLWRLGPLSRAIGGFGDFTRRRLPLGVRPGPRALVRWCQERWELARPREVPLHALFLALGRPWRLRVVARRLFGRTRDVPGAVASHRCVLGEPLDFSSPETLERHGGIGWSFPEPTGTWTEGREARLRLRLSRPTAGDLLLRMSLWAAVTPAAPVLAVELVINDARLARWRFGGASYRDDDRRLRIPARVARRYAPMEVTVLIRRPLVPAALGLGDDYRALGVHVQRVVVEEAGRDGAVAGSSSAQVRSSHHEARGSGAAPRTKGGSSAR